MEEKLFHLLSAYRAAETFGEEALKQRMMCVSTMFQHLNDLNELVSLEMPELSAHCEVGKKELLDEIKKKMQ